MTFFEWLDSTPIPSLVLESAWGFPIVELVHILGMTLIIGGLVILNMRLLGMSRKTLPVDVLMEHILPWLTAGCIISLLSGLTFFASDASRYWVNNAFRIKLILLVLASLNFAVFYLRIYRNVSVWKVNVHASASARVSAVLSLVMLFGILTAGRLIAYTHELHSFSFLNVLVK